MATANATHTLRCIPLLLTLTGCGLVTISTGSTHPGGGTGPATEAASSSGGPDAAESREELEQREQARAWFGKCSIAYDDFMTTWRPLDAEAKKVVAETRDKPFYEAYPRLVSEYRKLRQEAKRLHGSKSLPTGYGQVRGTASELLLAIAALQVKTDSVSEFALDPHRDAHLGSFPMTGDDAFDRQVFCSYATYLGVGPGKLAAFNTDDQRFPARWMTRSEKRAFTARVAEHLEATRLALNLLIETRNKWLDRNGGTYGGDYGIVKQVKALPDGSTVVQGKALDTPYTCAHTGNYRWNGVEFNDCDVVDLPTRETYGFKVTFKELPPSGLKRGDKLSFSGLNPKGRSFEAKHEASWEGVLVRVITRGGKIVHTTDLNDKVDAR